MGAAPLAMQALVDRFVGAAHRDLMKVKELLAWQSQLVNRRATWDETALGAAAHTAQVDIAEFLLSVGAPLDIFTAAMLGRAECVLKMLAVSPMLAAARGAHGLPVLYFAAITGRLDLADALTSHGADVNAAEGAPLHGAMSFNQPAMVEWLLQHGARVNLARDGRAPLAAPKARDNTTVLDLPRHHGAEETAPATV